LAGLYHGLRLGLYLFSARLYHFSAGLHFFLPGLQYGHQFILAGFYHLSNFSNFDQQAF
jgi:hypothetical protein